MIFGAALLLLIACVHHSTQFKIEKVKPLWRYKSNTSSNTNSLPDSIHIDIDSPKISLNLIKQSKRPNKSPLILTQFEGQKSVLKPNKHELMGFYNDQSLDASATVVLIKNEMTEETLYMATFNNGNKSFSLEPSPFLHRSDRDSDMSNNAIKLLDFGGRIHSLIESPARKLRQNAVLDEDHINEMTKDMRMRKRSIGTPAERRLMTVEIFTVIEYSVFNEFFKASTASTIPEKKEDATNTIRYIFAHIMEEVKNNYENIEIEGLKFTTTWVGALIAESPSSDYPFTERENDDDPDISYDKNALNKLLEWEINETKRHDDGPTFPRHDALAVFTRRQLNNKNKHVLGTAFKKICTIPGLSLITYKDFLSTVIITSHEIGHNLGMEHDNITRDCEEKSFIMHSKLQYDEETFLNSYLFSKCSLSDLNNTIHKLDSKNKNCLTDGEEEIIENREKDMLLNLYPGQIYDIHEQCKMFYGRNSFYCGGEENDEKMCQIVKCFVDSVCKNSTKHNAMDGTSCSEGSWCRRGKCVPDSRAPRAPKRCVNGDKKFSYSSNRTCDQLGSIFIRDPCQRNFYSNDCCATCANNTYQGEGCNDLITECSSLEPRDCYSNYYAKTCCKTCQTLAKNATDANCLYGDKGDDCLDLVPAVCHLNTQYCCESCAAYLVSSNGSTSSASSSTKGDSSETTLPSIMVDVTAEGSTASISDSGNGVEYVQTSVTTLPITMISSIGSTVTDSSTQEFNDNLKNIRIWGKSLFKECEQLVKHDSSLCVDDDVQKYCHISCTVWKWYKDLVH